MPFVSSRFSHCTIVSENLGASEIYKRTLRVKIIQLFETRQISSSLMLDDIPGIYEHLDKDLLGDELIQKSAVINTTLKGPHLRLSKNPEVHDSRKPSKGWMQSMKFKNKTKSRLTSLLADIIFVSDRNHMAPS